MDFEETIEFVFDVVLSQAKSEKLKNDIKKTREELFGVLEDFSNCSDQATRLASLVPASIRAWTAESVSEKLKVAIDLLVKKGGY